MMQENELRVPPWHDDVPPYEEIARLIESDDTDPSSFASYAPHPVEADAHHVRSHVRNMGWHAWTGTHWEVERGLEVATRHAQTTAARIGLEADVMAATPNEQRAIDAASQARD
jgi:hypothetical protein